MTTVIPTETPNPEPAPLAAPWPTILGLGVGIPAAIGAVAGATVGIDSQVRAANALFGASIGALTGLKASLLGMVVDNLLTRAYGKRTGLRTALAYGIPHLLAGTPFVATIPLYLKQGSVNPPEEEPPALATKWYNPLLAGIGIMTPIGALGGYALEGASGIPAGSLIGALTGTAVGLQGMLLDYLVTKIRGKRGPIQSAFVYSLPYFPAIVGTALLGGAASARPRYVPVS
jgi:hypothetical protein